MYSTWSLEGAALVDTVRHSSRRQAAPILNTSSVGFVLPIILLSFLLSHLYPVSKCFLTPLSLSFPLAIPFPEVKISVPHPLLFSLYSLLPLSTPSHLSPKLIHPRENAKVRDMARHDILTRLSVLYWSRSADLAGDGSCNRYAVQPGQLTAALLKNIAMY
jgi:hypothetical protein